MSEPGSKIESDTLVEPKAQAPLDSPPLDVQTDIQTDVHSDTLKDSDSHVDTPKDADTRTENSHAEDTTDPSPPEQNHTDNDDEDEDDYDPEKMFEIPASPRKQDDEQTQSPPKGSPEDKSPKEPQREPQRDSHSQNTSPEAAYKQFLHREHLYNQEGNWEKFPAGSRMFVGNLPHNPQKQELYWLFIRFGAIAQISVKNKYGFVQFESPESASKVMEEFKGPEGCNLRGNRLKLEISKPQQFPGTEVPRDRRRTSAFPDTRRSRERSPVRGNNAYGHGYRSRSPPRPARRPSLDVQVFIIESVEPAYVNHVDMGLRSALLSYRVDRIHKSDLERAIQKLAYEEGALGVILLKRSTQAAGVVTLQVFNRGPQGVRYDEYSMVDLDRAIELLRYAKSHSKGQGQVWGPYMPNVAPIMPPVMSPVMPIPTMPIPMASSSPDVSDVMSKLRSMDPAALQQVLSAVQTSGINGASSQAYGGYPQPQHQGQTYNPTTGVYSGVAGPKAAPTNQVQNIMDQLARLQNQQH